MNILEKIRVVSESLGSNVFENLLAMKQSLERDITVIGIMGTANAGKTTVINKIAGTSIPTTLVSSMESYFVSPDDRFGTGFHSTDEWIKNNKIALLEKPEKLFKPDSKDREYCDYFSDIDICLYIIDAQMAYTKNDSLILEHLIKFGIPTIVCVSKYEKLQSETRSEVLSYLSDKFPKAEYLNYIPNNNFKAIADIVDTIKERIESYNNSEQVSQTRNNILSFYIIDSVAKLYEICQKQLEAALEAEKKVELMTVEKKNKISALEAEWMRIELALSTRRQNTEDKLRTRLSARKADMLRRLNHDIEVCSDVKHYWEKELSYRIDDMMRAELQTYTQIMNTDIVNTLRWLQDEILKSFKKQSGLVPSITCTIDNKETTLDTIELSDNKKLKIVTRIGTAATVIAAGTLLATSGVAGVVMAISMLSGIGAEWLMGRKTKEARGKVQDILPTILDKCELVYINQISDSLKVSYGEIIDNLKSNQAEWKSKALATIEEERLIAIHNCGREKLNKSMNVINEISASLIN